MRILLALAAATLLSGIAAAATETCFFKSEQTSGLNKICFYDCPSGAASITVKSTQLCPLNIKR